MQGIMGFSEGGGGEVSLGSLLSWTLLFRDCVVDLVLGGDWSNIRCDTVTFKDYQISAGYRS